MLLLHQALARPLLLLLALPPLWTQLLVRPQPQAPAAAGRTSLSPNLPYWAPTRERTVAQRWCWRVLAFLRALTPLLAIRQSHSVARELPVPPRRRRPLAPRFPRVEVHGHSWDSSCRCLCSMNVSWVVESSPYRGITLPRKLRWPPQAINVRRGRVLTTLGLPVAWAHRTAVLAEFTDAIWPLASVFVQPTRC